MGAKTFKRLAILVTTILVAGLSIFFFQRYQVQKLDQSLLAQAELANKEGKYEDAAPLYEEHLEVSPDDQEAKLKYAEVLLKGPKDLGRLQRAAQLYDQYVNRFPADNKARRRLAELTVEMGRYDKARPLLETLLKTEPNKDARPGPDDGALRFLLGRCQEEMDDLSRAEESYRDAIKFGAPQRIEAASRLAALILKRPQKSNEELKDAKKEADGVIDAMVKSDPENYQVYLRRGRYYRLVGKTPAEREVAKKDFETAREKNPNEPGVYTEMAELERASKNYEEARHVIEAGLTVLRNDPALLLEQAMLEMPGSIDKAIMSLRHGVDLLPDQPALRWNLANLLAQRGDTAPLLKEIGELKRLNFPQLWIGILEARYLFNCNEWEKAISTLVRLQPESPEHKAQVNDLLAQCYHNRKDRAREREAREQSVRANPQDLQARLQLAALLTDQGDIENAIKEYRQLLAQVRQERRDAELNAIRDRLVRILISRNQQRPMGQRDWVEAENLIKEFDPQSIESISLRTELLLAQGKIAEAQELLHKARSRTSPEINLWIMSAEVSRRQRKFDDARQFLDEAQKSLGDSVALRLERSRLVMAQGGEGRLKALGALAENTNTFSPADRRRLLEVLAQEATILNDRTLMIGLWSQVAKLDPDDLNPRRVLFELALQGKNRADIEYRLNEVKRIDSSDGPYARLGEAQYTIWQAENTTDRSEQARLRNTAKLQLKELMQSRKDWPQIPRMLAELTLSDLSRPDLTEEERAIRMEEAVKLYSKVVELGQKDLDTIRRATDLLYAQGLNKGEVTPLWEQLSKTTEGNAPLRQALLEALLRHGDNERALELARDAKAANPNDFQASRLVSGLLAKQHPDEAEKELRDALNANPADPDRWLALVQFFTTNKQIVKAERAVQEAESAINDKQLALAQCCELLGQAYKTAGQDEKKSKDWLDRAGRRYAAAGNEQTEDLNMTRQYIEFLVRRASFTGKVDDWKIAHDRSRTFLEKTRSTKDPEILKRRPDSITQLVEVVFRLYQSDPRPELLNEAQDLIGQLKALRPDTFNVLELEARLFKARNQMDKAVELIRSASRRPNLPDPLWLALANLAEKLGQGELAADLLRQRLEQSKSPILAITLAGLLERLGRFREAEVLYKQCVENGQDNALVLNNLAWLMVLLNDDKTVALEYINRAIKLGGPKFELLDTRGVIYTKLGQSEDAITDLSEAVKQDPSGPKYFHLAQVYLQAGKMPDAKKSLEEARAKGLTPDRLHALEVTAYQQLLKDLATH